MSEGVTNLSASRARHPPGVVMRFLAQLNRPISLGRLWVIMFLLRLIAGILAMILRALVLALR